MARDSIAKKVVRECRPYYATAWRTHVKGRLDGSGLRATALQATSPAAAAAHLTAAALRKPDGYARDYSEEDPEIDGITRVDRRNWWVPNRAAIVIHLSLVQQDDESCRRELQRQFMEDPAQACREEACLRNEGGNDPGNSFLTEYGNSPDRPAKFAADFDCLMADNQLTQHTKLVPDRINVYVTLGDPSFPLIVPMRERLNAAVDAFFAEHDDGARPMLMHFPNEPVMARSLPGGVVPRAANHTAVAAVYWALGLVDQLRNNGYTTEADAVLADCSQAEPLRNTITAPSASSGSSPDLLHAIIATTERIAEEWPWTEQPVVCASVVWAAAAKVSKTYGSAAAAAISAFAKGIGTIADTGLADLAKAVELLAALDDGIRIINAMNIQLQIEFERIVGEL